MATFGVGPNPYADECNKAAAPADPRLVALDHLIVTERENEEAKRRLDEASKGAAVASEAFRAAGQHLREVLGYESSGQRPPDCDPSRY